MQRLIDETRLNLLLEQKKDCIGKRVTWDSILSAVSFLLGALLASYSDLCGIPGVVFKTLFLSAGVFFWQADKVSSIAAAKTNAIILLINHPPFGY